MSWRTEYEREKERATRYEGYQKRAEERAETAHRELTEVLDAVMDVFDLRDQYPDYTIEDLTPVWSTIGGPMRFEKTERTAPGRIKFKADLKAAAQSKHGREALARILGRTNTEESN